MDFVTGLPESSGFDAICVVVDRLSKAFHEIACHSTIDAEGLAKLYLQNVWRLHGSPDTIVSDRGTLFVSQFWSALCKRLAITSLLSSAYHPETNGQTERTNAVMEQYLRSFVSYMQEDWAEWCPMSEFAGNNTVSATTEVTTFLANTGFHPWMGFEPALETTKKPELKAQEFVNRMESISQVLHDEMRYAQAVQETYANRNQVPAPVFKPGDLVWLKTKNIRTERPAKKLDWKKVGRFKILETIGKYAYKLELPPSMKIHPVFHVSLVELAATDAHEGHIPPSAPPVIVDDGEEYEVEKILDSKKVRRIIKYLVK